MKGYRALICTKWMNFTKRCCHCGAKPKVWALIWIGGGRFWCNKCYIGRKGQPYLIRHRWIRLFYLTWITVREMVRCLYQWYVSLEGPYVKGRE